MQLKSKAMWSLATSLVAFTSVLSADMSDSQMRNIENRVSALEQRKGASGVINPNGRPQVRDGADLFLTADLLLWQAHEGGLSLSVEQDIPNDATFFDDGEVKNLEWEWDWGFRVGLGYNLPHDGWDLYLNYTWLHSTAHKTTHVNGTSEILSAVQGAPASIGVGACDRSRAKWHANLNVLDLELGRQFFTSKWLTLRPHFGLRTAWIRQEFEVDYKNRDTNVTSIAKRTENEVEQHNNFWGLGIRAGVDTQWGLGRGWSIYGNAAISLLYGFVHVRMSEDKEAKEVTTEDYEMVNSTRGDKAVTDLQLGLRWARMFDNDRWGLMLQAGWEHHMWFGQNQMLRFTDNTTQAAFVVNQGDLSYQGWTLNVRFDF